MLGRTVHNNLVSIKEYSTSNKGYCLIYHVLYKHNYTYRKNLKENFMYNCWQKTEDIIRIYKRVPRKKKKWIQL